MICHFFWMEPAEEIKKRVFDGTVPVRFNCSTFDSEAPPLCFNAPRSVLLGTFAFAEFGPLLEGVSNLWFCHNGKSLKWQLPLGCLFDAMAPGDGAFWVLDIDVRATKASHNDMEGSPQNSLPSGVLKCDNAVIPRQFFLHSFKESMFLTVGNMELLQSQVGLREEIEEKILSRDYESFTRLFTKRIVDPSEWKRWPIRIVAKNLGIMLCGLQIEGASQTVADALVSKGLIDVSHVIIHGVRMETSTRLAEIASLVLYPDGFIYVLVE